MSVTRLFKRLTNTAVLWFWILNALRFSSSFLLLPLLLVTLSPSDFGMYFKFVMLTAIVPILDFGIGPNVERNVAYAMAGAKTLEPLGLSGPVPNGSPNYALLWDLLHAVEQLYRRVAVFGLLLLGGIGSWTVSVHIAQTDFPTRTWIAWIIALVAAVLELYLGWWNNFLHGCNQLLPAAKYAAIGYAANLGLACVLLKSGVGLMSVPIASLVGSITQRTLNRRASLRLLPQETKAIRSTHPRELLLALWPNTWRMGCLLLTGYASTNLIVYIPQFGLVQNAEYGLTLRLLTVVQGIAVVWVIVKWPKVAQLQSQKDFDSIRKVLWPRFWLQTLTFVLLASAIVIVGPTLLRKLSPEKHLLPPLWTSLLAVNAFLQMSFTFWTTLLWMQNRIPSFIPTIITSVASVILTFVFVSQTQLGVASFVLAPLLCGAVFNYWFWWHQGAKMLGTNLLDFLIRRPVEVPT